MFKRSGKVTKPPCLPSFVASDGLLTPLDLSSKGTRAWWGPATWLGRVGGDWAALEGPPCDTGTGSCRVEQGLEASVSDRVRPVSFGVLGKSSFCQALHRKRFHIGVCISCVRPRGPPCRSQTPAQRLPASGPMRWRLLLLRGLAPHQIHVPPPPRPLFVFWFSFLFSVTFHPLDHSVYATALLLLSLMIQSLPFPWYNKSPTVSGIWGCLVHSPIRPSS